MGSREGPDRAAATIPVTTPVVSQGQPPPPASGAGTATTPAVLCEVPGGTATGGTDAPSGQVVGPHVDAAIEPRQSRLVCGVGIGGPLQHDVLVGPSSNAKDSAGTRHCPSPPGKYALPVIEASTSADARLKVLWPEM